MTVLRSRIACAAIALLITLPQVDQAAAYTTVVIGDSSAFGTIGMALNDSGEVAGVAHDTPYTMFPFKYSHGVITRIPNLAGLPLGMNCLGIDDRGYVTGTATYVGYYRGFIYNDTFSLDIGGLDGGSTAYTFVRGMSPLGLVVGSSFSSVLGTSHAIEYSSGVMTDLGAIDNNNRGPLSSAAYAASRRGWVCGSSGSPLGTNHAILISSMVVLDLAPNDTFTTSIGYGLNEAGDVVGQRGLYATLFTGGKIINLGTLGGASSEAYGIDNNGIIVGRSQRADGTMRAFLRDTSSVMHDLNDLCDSTNLNLSEARAINNRGWILANANGLAAYLLIPSSQTGVDDQGSGALPLQFQVSQNYPNPFNPATTIEYSVPSRTHVTIEIFNELGQKVRTLVNEVKSAGSHRIEWNGRDGAGRPVSTGVYLYRFQAGDVMQTKKMLLLK